MANEGTTARRGRPRDSAVDQRVLDVAWDLLLSGGYAGLNVDEVAERAAVAKTTLYRRWPTKDHLAIAVVTRMIPFALVPDTGDICHDLTEFAVSIAASLHLYRTAGGSDGVSAGLAGELVAAAARHPDIGDLIRTLHARRHAMALARLKRASEREGLRTDIDHGLLIDQISGPIYYRALITGATTDRSYAERLVRAVLAGCTGHPVQFLLEMDRGPGAAVAGQPQVVGDRVNDPQAAAVLGGERCGFAGRDDRDRSVAAVHHLDHAPAVYGPGHHLVLFLRPRVQDHVGARLAEGKGDVGPGVDGHAEGLQATVENLAADRHAGGIARHEQHHLELHVLHLPAGAHAFRRPL